MLLLKLTLVPLLIGAITLIGRRYGSQLAGLLSGLPVIAGPITYFMYLEQGSDFARHAASATVSGVAALSSFCFAYAWLAARWRWPLTALFAFAIYGLMATGIVTAGLGIHASFLLSLAVVCLQLRLSPPTTASVSTAPASNSEVITRMLCAAGLVLLVTYFARQLGPAWSGVFAAFPIAATVIALFSHRNVGANQARIALKALKIGLLSLLSFFYVLAQASPVTGFNTAFALAAAVALLLQALIWLARRQLASKRPALQGAG